MRMPACWVLLLTPLLPAQLRVSLSGTWDLGPAAADGGAPADHDQSVRVPGAFEDALGPDFDGVAWCRRRLPLQPSWRGAQVRVEFAAVATHAAVFCNGRPVGEHLGGWTPFRVDLTAALRWDGTDELAVRVDERIGHNTQGFLPVIQPHFGGIWQPVTLCVDDGPVFDRLDVFAFGRLLAPDPAAATHDARVTCRVGVLAAPDADALQVRAEVRDGAQLLAQATLAHALPGEPAELELPLRLPAERAWRPAAPHLLRLVLTLHDRDGTELDRVERRVGCRSLTAHGTTVLWNGSPLQVRGVLHWGHSPPHLAPPDDPDHWRRQLEDFRARGFNLLKCCLWVPPPCVYELCDELGLLCWQEYPTWHPQIDAAHRDELLREYGEFFRRDGSHASVAFRSITCETGHRADLEVVRALYDACHEAVPDTLVVDDSSWIGWQRVTDFWDEHPYGNARWWPQRLQDFRDHVAKHGAKPLLLGECMAADTWIDLHEWDRRHGGAAPWWTPLCLDDQRRFESWLVAEFGADTLRQLPRAALDFGMAQRRYQIERLRATIPDAGYVVSVARDFAKARMGLYDDFDRAKWSAAEWAWHGDAMLCLDRDRRAFVPAADGSTRLGVRVARGGDVDAPRQVHPLAPLPPVARPTRHRVVAAVAGLEAGWDVWLLPPFDDARPAAPAPGLRVLDQLDQAALDFVAAGGRALLRVDGDRGDFRSAPLWHLRGAPFAPPHPAHDALPAAMLLDLMAFDLDGGRMMPWDALKDQVDPILAFWETHDIDRVRAHLLVFDCRIGEGRLLASCLDRATPAGRFAEHRLLHHLATGPAPARALAPDTVTALRQLLAERTVPLESWRFRTDPDDRGLAAGWQLPATATDAAPWRPLRAGSHWENQAEDLRHYSGVAWYHRTLDLPDDWPSDPVHAVFEGVDDSFELWLDGRSLGRRGDPATGHTVWLEPQTFALGPLSPGRHTLTLRVVDHQGSGGLWKPAMLTTGPVGAARDLLQ
ncbi:MAG: sugar-binding domain-containing protein [Planctomycetota bacterium]